MIQRWNELLARDLAPETLYLIACGGITGAVVISCLVIWRMM